MKRFDRHNYTNLYHRYRYLYLKYNCLRFDALSLLDGIVGTRWQWPLVNYIMWEGFNWKQSMRYTGTVNLNFVFWWKQIVSGQENNTGVPLSVTLVGIMLQNTKKVNNIRWFNFQMINKKNDTPDELPKNVIFFAR